MSETERWQRTISSTPRLTPEEVAGRTFSTAFRGVSETDVRAFLKRVSEELTAARGREQELLTTIDDLEARLRAPQPLDEQALLDALGEETTRLLRSAREAGIDIRAKAEERAARLVHEAKEDADRLRQEADGVLEVKTREADAVVEGLLEDAERRASDLMRVADERAEEVRETAEQYTADLRARVERETITEIETSRSRAETMVAEATALREQIIDDLARRRELLTGQLEELRAGRDRLLDAYRVVKRTFLEATEALAQVEARATAARSVGGSDPADLADTVATETEVARLAGLDTSETQVEPTESDSAHSEPESEAAESELPDVEVAAEAAEPESAEPEVAEPATAELEATPSASPEPEATENAEGEPAANLADVDDLFARLRAGAQSDAESDADAVASDLGAAISTPATDVNGEAEIDIASAEAEAETTTAVDDPDAVPDWLVTRDAALAPLRVALVRQVKLAIGDEQNDVLDKIRRHKGRPTAATVLPAPDAQAESWAKVLNTAVTDAYRAARGDDATVPDDVATGIARSMVEPLRDRLVAAIDGAHEPGETTNQVAERIGARYREWKNRSSEASVDDALVGAYARGRYDAAADDAVLAWCTPPGGCCPDCADNALEPTAKGATFPTGQQFPPAHAGCRCTVVSVAADATATVGAEAESTSS